MLKSTKQISHTQEKTRPLGSKGCKIRVAHVANHLEELAIIQKKKKRQQQKDRRERPEGLSVLHFQIGNAYYYETTKTLAGFITVLFHLFADINISKTRTVAGGIAHPQFPPFCWMTA